MEREQMSPVQTKECSGGKSSHFIWGRLFGRVGSEWERLLVSLLAALTIGLTAHAYAFLHLTVSFDSLAEFRFSSAYSAKSQCSA